MQLEKAFTGASNDLAQRLYDTINEWRKECSETNLMDASDSLVGALRSIKTVEWEVFGEYKKAENLTTEQIFRHDNNISLAAQIDPAKLKKGE